MVSSDVSRDERDDVEWSRESWDAQGLGGGDYLASFASIARLHQMMMQRIDESLKPFQLKLNPYLLLLTLMLTENGARRMNRLGAHMMVHPTTVTVVVDQLEKDGLVSRKPHPTDRRVTLVEITAKGLKVATAASRAVAGENFGLPPMEPQEVESLVRTLAVIREQAGDVALGGTSSRKSRR